MKLAFKLSDTKRPTYVWCDKQGHRKKNTAWCEAKCTSRTKCKAYRLVKQEAK